MTVYRRLRFLRTMICLAIGWGLATGWLWGDLEKLENLRLVPHPSNAGDSFRVTDGEEVWYLRLYFVDCPETDAGSETMARRVREQTRYFGMESHADTIYYGRKATAAVEDWLSEPFTAYTTHADAMGRSTKRRIFAFVVTADGQDLDKLLVKNGLARAYGVGRRDHEGTHRDERRARLEDLEAAAMLDRRGIWSATNAEGMARQRAEQREEVRELAQIRRELGLGGLEEGEKILVNEASVEELQRLPGIGPSLAGRVIEGRPFHSVGDLQRVSGIGPATADRLEEFLDFSTPEAGEE